MPAPSADGDGADAKVSDPNTEKDTGSSHCTPRGFPVSFSLLYGVKRGLCLCERPASALGLNTDHMSEDAARLQQLCGRALLGYRAVPEHHDLVCAGDGAHPVGDDEDGFVLIRRDSAS